jgi:hypothetical protein
MYNIKAFTQREIVYSIRDRHLCSKKGLQMYYYIKTWMQGKLISSNEDRHFFLERLQMYYIKTWTQGEIVYKSRDRHLYSKMATNILH